MTTITFDTLRAAKLLQTAGFSAQQAEALANMQKSSLDEIANSRELATKSDLLIVQNNLEKQLASQKQELTQTMLNLLIGFAACIISSIGIGVAVIIWLMPRG